MTAEADVEEFYSRRVRDFRASHAAVARRWRRFANFRLAAFVLVIASVWWLTNATGMTYYISELAVAVTLAAFVALVAFSSAAKARVLRLADLVTINEEGILRIRRNWPAIERRPWNDVAASHPYAADLDVFGSASLVQLFPAISAAPGRSTLASWLLVPASPAELQHRQQAVLELKARVDWRDELILHTRRINIDSKQLETFQKWAADDDLLANSYWITGLAFVLPIVGWSLAIAQGIGVVTHGFWLIPFAFGGLLTLRFKLALKITLAQVQGQRNLLRGYAGVADVVSKASFDSAMLCELQHALGNGNAARQMRALETLADCADIRLSPMLHFVVQAVTLWDFHVARLLNGWKRRVGSQVEMWIEAIGITESLVALATIAHDNADWVFPDVASSETIMMEATALGHPLLPASTRIANDVVVGPPGTLLFVTGSNMAGKSTLLRAIGLNVVLAQAGSVVCASAMRCPPVSLYTSMRVQDSLERGVSYFMAELERLKLIVDAADATRHTPDRTLLYLLDEILHGTNSSERAIAARHVLAHLIALGAIGAVTTHDLQLADAEVLTRAAQHVHFQEDFARAASGRPSMHFDYQLRPGKATSSNALKLLELVGLTTDHVRLTS